MKENVAKCCFLGSCKIYFLLFIKFRVYSMNLLVKHERYCCGSSTGQALCTMLC